jgi:DNA-binding transcriptional regulator GbsR (MarR family)
MFLTNPIGQLVAAWEKEKGGRPSYFRATADEQQVLRNALEKDKSWASRLAEYRNIRRTTNQNLDDSQMRTVLAIPLDTPCP